MPPILKLKCSKKVNTKMTMVQGDCLGSNVFDSIATGTIQGVKLAVNEILKSI